MHCPECGSDLREVGIDHPGKKLMITPVVFILLWTLCLPIPSCTLSGVLVYIGPKTNMYNESVSLQPKQLTDYNDVSVNISQNWLGVSLGLQCEVNISGTNNQSDRIDIELTNMTYQYYGHSFTSSGQPAQLSTQTTGAFNQTVMLMLMQNVGVNTQNQQVIDEVTELVQIIQFAAQGSGSIANITPQHFNVTQNYSYPSDIPAWWYIMLLVVCFLLIWIGGIVQYFVIRKRMLKSHASDQEQSVGTP